MDKIYSAFISSTAKVAKYRTEAEKTLLNLGFYCHCMEHFTVHNFEQIKSYIRDSDFVLVIMGTDYGTIDPKTGKSWTQLEFEFSREIGKPTLIIVTPELRKAISKNEAIDEKQLSFYNLTSDSYDLYSRSIDSRYSLETILTQYVAGSTSSFSGWVKAEITGRELEKWTEDNLAYNLNGTWYHFHYSETDRSYLRIGTIKIEQAFTPSAYKTCNFVGQNYGVVTDENKKIILNSAGLPKVDRTHHSKWEGEYTLQGNGVTFTGIYRTTRSYTESNFVGQKKSNPITRGIHDYDLDIDNTAIPLDFFQGVFHDEAPSVKQGNISVFRSEEERNQKVVEYLKKHKQLSDKSGE